MSYWGDLQIKHMEVEWADDQERVWLKRQAEFARRDAEERRQEKGRDRCLMTSWTA